MVSLEADDRLVSSSPGGAGGHFERCAVAATMKKGDWVKRRNRRVRIGKPDYT